MSSHSTPLDHLRKTSLQRKPSTGRLPVASSRITSSTRVLRARSSSREPDGHSCAAATASSTDNALKRSLTPSQNHRESTAKRPTLGCRAPRNEDSPMITPAPSRHLSNFPPSTIRTTALKQSQPGNVLLAHDKVRQLTDELQVAQAQIRSLTQNRDKNVDNMLTLERKLLDFEREILHLNSQLDERDTRVKKVEYDRQILDEKLEASQKTHQAAVATAKEQVEAANASKKSAVEKLHALTQLNTDLEQKSRLADHGVARAKQSAFAAEQKAQTLMQNMEEMRQELTSTRKKLESSQQEVTEAQKELETVRKLKVDENISQSGTGNPEKSLEVLKHELSNQVDRLKLLEHSNTRLSREVEMHRAKQTNIEILKEENRNLNARLNSMEEVRRKLAKVEVEREKLLRERSEWTVYLEKEHDSTFSTPHELSKALATIRIENATLQERLGTRETQIKSRDRMIAELEARLEEAERERDDEYTNRTKAESQVTIAERNRELDKRRIQMLNEQLMSYTAEEKLIASGSYDSQKDLKVTHLEELLESHQKEVSRLRQELAEAEKLLAESDLAKSCPDLPEASFPGRSPEKSAAVKASLAEQIARNEALELEIDALMEKNTVLELNVESFQRQVNNLERDLGRGAYNPHATQVLAPDGGPLQQETAIRSATLQALKAENSALLKRVSSLEKGIKPSSDEQQGLVPRESLVSLQHEIERLEADVSGSVKSRRRLTEMYEEGTKAYRKAMWEILGYSLETVANGEFRLRSIFKDENAASMLFVPGKADGGSVEYKPGHQPFHQSREVVDSFRTWVEDRKSLPCFAAALTLELYESSTRGQAAGYRKLG